MNNVKQIPCSVEAERYVIGCLLIDSSLAEEVMNEISHNDFYVQENKNIMLAIEELYARSKLIDQLTVLDELKRLNLADATGGVEYISGIVESMPSTANIDIYVDILHDKTLERRLYEVSLNISDKVLKGDLHIKDLLAEAEKDINDVVNMVRVADFKRVDLLTENVFDIIEQNQTKKGNLIGIDTGFAELNNLIYGFQKGNLIIVAARPGLGKSTIGLNFAARACMNHHHVAFFSLEMGYDQLIMRMLSTYSSINLSKIITGQLSGDEMRLLLQAKATINKFPLYIDQNTTSSIRDIKAKCLKLKKENHLDMIIVDYLQLLTSGERAQNRTEEVSKISRFLKEMARVFNVPVIALSQLSRNIEQREDKTPVLPDLRESGSIEQDADIVMFLHRPAAKEGELDDTTKSPTGALTELIIAKNRQGMTGKCKLMFKATQSVFVGYNESGKRR